MDTPDFVANFQLAEYAEVVYFVGGTDAHYEYNWDYSVGEQPPADYWYDPVYVKAAYYQGQWEYVDGIPTPL